MLNIKNGMLVLDNEALSGLIVEGENTLALKFNDGDGELKINYIQRPKPVEKQESKEEASAEEPAKEVIAEQSIAPVAPAFMWIIIGISLTAAAVIALIFIRKIKENKK